MNPMDVYAQTDTIGPTVWRMIYFLIAFLVVLLFFLIYRKLRGRMGSGTSVSTGGLDLMSLKKKGLLTPEELERVGQSMMRQMKEKEEAERRKRGLKSADGLLLDPEVRRLEVLAAARARSEQTTPEQTANKPKTSNVEGQGAPVEQPAALEPNVKEDLSSVELPLDIQQLADSGLLSPEEILNVKRRLLERRRLGGQ